MTFAARAEKLLAREGRAALVTLARVQGSSPREEGAQMLVTAAGFVGSIGGGTLEWQALAEAQKRLRLGEDGASRRTYALGPDLGQCCGGRVSLETRVITTADDLRAALTPAPPPRHILLYGAGHVGKSLVLLLAQAPFTITWVDPRPEAFPAAVPANVAAHAGQDVLSPISATPEGAFVIVMSHSHELDFTAADAALRNSRVARVLLIGSATKRARFLSRLAAAGHGPEALSRLICPIGTGEISGKTPYAVALSTAHHCLALDEALHSAQRMPEGQQERQAG